jgi:hypothetical protein
MIPGALAASNSQLGVGVDRVYCRREGSWKDVVLGGTSMRNGIQANQLESIHIDEKFYIVLLRANRAEYQLDNSAPLGSLF